jgi:hypothetical protein
MGGKFMKHVLFGTVAAICLAAASFQAHAVEGTLTIVTSYPKDTTSTFKAAFEKKYPKVKVEMLKKKTFQSRVRKEVSEGEGRDAQEEDHRRHQVPPGNGGQQQVGYVLGLGSRRLRGPQGR